MAANFLKLWVQGNLNKLAVNRARNEIQSTGRALPCSVVSVSGSLVTVKFELNSKPWTLPQITIPKAESQWIRTPIQKGDMGITIPADVLIGNVSGLGGGVPTMARPGNLSALVFLPVASKNFSAVNINAAYISGPQGAVIQDEAGTAIATIGGGRIALQGNTFVTGNLGSSSGITAVVTTPTGQTLMFTNGILTGVI